MKLVYIVRIYTRDILTDYTAKLKSIFGGRLKMYEKMMTRAIDSAWEEFHDKYPDARNIRVDTEQVSDGVMVTITGEV